MTGQPTKIRRIDMAKETAAQKRSRISALLADYDARSRELNKLMVIVKGLKEQVRELDAGAYGEWFLAYGTPRQIMDQAAARKLLEEHKVVVPMTTTQAPIVVSPVAGK